MKFLRSSASRGLTALAVLLLLGVVAGIVAILAVVAGLVLSIIGGFFRGAILIHPFAATSDLKVRLNGLLALLVQEQRREWAELADRIDDELEPSRWLPSFSKAASDA